MPQSKAKSAESNGRFAYEGWSASSTKRPGSAS